VTVAVVFTANALSAQPASLSAPKTWNDLVLATLEVPSPEPRYTPVHVGSDYYYRIPVRPIFRTHPRYRPGKEPPGYMEWLRGREPEIVFDPSKLKSEEDWTRAGELVFHYPVSGLLLRSPPSHHYAPICPVEEVWSS